MGCGKFFFTKARAGINLGVGCGRKCVKEGGERGCGGAARETLRRVGNFAQTLQQSKGEKIFPLDFEPLQPTPFIANFSPTRPASTPQVAVTMAPYASRYP